MVIPRRSSTSAAQWAMFPAIPPRRFDRPDRSARTYSEIGVPDDLARDWDDLAQRLWERDFRIEEGETPEDVFDLYRRACDRSRRALEAVSLDDPIENPDRSSDYNVRWVVVHMLEETARHAGHADIIREQLDGRTGTGYGI
jgi:hypothetical protein